MLARTHSTEQMSRNDNTCIPMRVRASHVLSMEIGEDQSVQVDQYQYLAMAEHDVAVAVRVRARRMKENGRLVLKVFVFDRL